jgi:signal transduction histidine kinase
LAEERNIGDEAKTNSERTGIIHGQDIILKRTIVDFQAIKEQLDICTDATGPSVFYSTPLWKEFVSLKNRGIRLRFVTEITKDNLKYSKEIMKIAELRHLDGIKGNFGVADGKDYGGAASVKEGQPPADLIHSNVKTFVEQQQFLFETLWSKAMPAEQRVIEIEKGDEPTIIEVIHSSSRAREIYLNLVRGATKEIMMVFPTPKAFARQERIGAIQAIRDAVNCRNAKARILIPVKDGNGDTLEHLPGEAGDKKQFPSNLIAPGQHQKTKEVMQQNPQHQPTVGGHGRPQENDEYGEIGMDGDSKHLSKNMELDIRHIERTSETKATILIVDKKHSLVMELRDDSVNTFDEAIGLSTYSNSIPGVLSYVSIFESLWTISDLYEQLKTHDRMQKEFINVAAHELRTPIQPILILSELVEQSLSLQKKNEARQLQKYLTIIKRNARRLQKLTNDILDITKIESHRLKLDATEFDLLETISNTIRDIMIEIAERKKNIVILCKNDFVTKTTQNNNKDKGHDAKGKTTITAATATDKAKKGIIVKGDENRISQVLSNLLNNAIKFTKEGHISVTVETNSEEKEVIVDVMDTGQGIDNEVFSKLFTKFTTDSANGSGLGLYISKNIVEAHGGRIWAKNNNDGNGATFSFTLPLTNTKFG